MSKPTLDELIEWFKPLTKRMVEDGPIGILDEELVLHHTATVEALRELKDSRELLEEMREHFKGINYRSEDWINRLNIFLMGGGDAR